MKSGIFDLFETSCIPGILWSHCDYVQDLRLPVYWQEGNSKHTKVDDIALGGYDHSVKLNPNSKTMLQLRTNEVSSFNCRTL
ncbi:9953_t:CDS:2 [Acaulospora colombiana]|uniref:9953_t:CDS:1 n=1 Tax=Acaulospora colombiana TaxID=27376 RepID=A0ACA9KPI9_9GLOM|nr:9953_t:CDS:2 [Acaulospora colombiana]